jgi:hypothetical protein
MGGALMIKANYRCPEIPEYQGNPLLEALPPITDASQTLDLLTNLPRYHPDERKHPVELRLHYLDRLFDIVQAQPEHLRVATTVSRLIRHGYKSRNPLLPAFAAHAYQLATRNSELVRPPPHFAKCRSGAYITGLSGIGKSTITEKILATYPQTIVHDKYQDKQFTQSQVVWLKLDCPHDGSQKQLCLSFFSALDQALDGATDYFDQNVTRRTGVEGYIPTMHRLSHSYHLGLLVIDELQHLTSAPRGGETKTLNLLVNIMNGIGVPILLLGTSESAGIFTKTFRNARRVSFAGPIILDRYSRDDPRFRLLLETLWHYQWTQKAVPLDEDMVDAMYDESQAVTDVVIAVYMMNQQLAITEGDETFTPQDVRGTISAHFPILAPALDALRRGDRQAYEQFRELMPPADQWNRVMVGSSAPDLVAAIDKLVEQRQERYKSAPAASESVESNHKSEKTRRKTIKHQHPPEPDASSTPTLPDLEAHVLRPAGQAKG